MSSLVVLGLADCDWNGIELLSSPKQGALTSGGEVAIHEYFGLGPDGDTYFNSYQCPDGVCVLRAKKNAKLKRVRNLPLADEYSEVLRNHKTAFIVADHIAYRLGEQRAHRLSELPLPAGLRFRAADRRGRLLAIDEEGALLRWSRSLGMQTLLQPSIRF